MGYIAWNDTASNAGPNTNQALWASDLANGVWARINCSLGTAIADPFGGTRAFTLTSTAIDGQISQTLSAGSSLQRINGVWIRRRTGSGNIQILRPDSLSWDTIPPITSSWARYSTIASPNTLRAIGIRLNTSGDAIDVYCPQTQDGGVLSNYDILTSALSLTALGNEKPRPGDRFSNWNPSSPIFGDEEEALGTGQLYTFSFRSDYLVTFEIRQIPQSSQALMLRLQRQLKTGGTVVVHTVDAGNRLYSICCAVKGADHAPKLSDPKLLEYSMPFALRNVSTIPGDSGDLVCQY